MVQLPSSGRETCEFDSHTMHLYSCSDHFRTSSASLPPTSDFSRRLCEDVKSKNDHDQQSSLDGSQRGAGVVLVLTCNPRYQNVGRVPADLRDSPLRPRTRVEVRRGVGVTRKKRKSYLIALADVRSTREHYFRALPDVVPT